MIYYIFKGVRKIKNIFHAFYCKYSTKIIFIGNKVKFKSFFTNGIPYVSVSRHGFCSFGDGLKINNGLSGNPIGCVQPCVIFCGNNAKIIIGDNVGLSSVALVAHCEIIIGNNVKIGGGTFLYDTDFHSLNFRDRSDKNLDIKNKKSAPIKIGDNVFIGAHSIILKNVSIGSGSVIGAGSLVTKNIPENQIWAGVPARFLRKID